MGANDVHDYTSNSGGNDLKVDSTTSLPVHNNAQNMSKVVNKVEGVRTVDLAYQDRGTKGQKHDILKTYTNKRKDGKTKVHQNKTI